MPVLFATFLLLALALSGAVAFSSERGRRALKWFLILALLLAWASLGKSLFQIAARTGSTLITPGGARQPHLIEQAVQQALLLLLTLGGPALLTTLLAWLSLKATKPGRRPLPPG